MWLASLFTISIASFVAFVQPYLLNTMLEVPKGSQGQLTGLIGMLRELVAVGLSALVGAWSDRIGRRRMYYIGFITLAAGLVVLPLAATTGELVALSLVFAVGVSIAPVMLSACVVDAPRDSCRGIWVASNNFLQGVGVLVMAILFARLPSVYAGLGLEPVPAGRFAYWTVACVALVAAAVMAWGLPRATPNREHARASGLRGQFRDAVRYGARNPRLSLAYAAAFIGRGDFSVLGNFFSLWVVQAGIAEGMSPGASLARGGMAFGIIQLAAILWAPGMGWIADRVDRVTGIALALALAGVTYTVLGTVTDPFASGFVLIAILVGMGEISVIVSAGALFGQEAPLEHRGPIVGFYNTLGAVGILFATGVGGLVFDRISPTAPFTMMGILNGLLLLAALYVRSRPRKPRPGT